MSALIKPCATNLWERFGPALAPVHAPPNIGWSVSDRFMWRGRYRGALKLP